MEKYLSKVNLIGSLENIFEKRNVADNYNLHIEFRKHYKSALYSNPDRANNVVHMKSY